MLEHWQGVTDQHDLHFLSDTGEDRCLHIHYSTHAERIAVVLVERYRIEPQFLGIAGFVEVVVVVSSGLLAVKILVRHREKGMVPKDLVLRDPTIGPLGKIGNFHTIAPLFSLLQGYSRFHFSHASSQ